MVIRSILLLAVAGAIAAPASGQTAAPDSATPSWAPPPGTHVRGYVLRPDSTPLNGWVVRYDHTFAAISSCAHCDDAVWVPIDSVFALEQAHPSARYRGSRLIKHVAKVTGAGAIAGFGLGVFLVIRRRCRCDGFDMLQVPAGTVLGTGVGLLAGVISGLVAETAEWTPVASVVRGQVR